MGYPSVDTIKLFCEILNRDGIDSITENIILSGNNPKLNPILIYFKRTLTDMLKEELYEEVDGYTTGFLTCLDIFRRQLDADDVSLEDLEIQIENMCGWTDYLEHENLKLRNELNELNRRNKELQELLSSRINGDLTDTT